MRGDGDEGTDCLRIPTGVTTALGPAEDEEGAPCANAAIAAKDDPLGGGG